MRTSIVCAGLLLQASSSFCQLQENFDYENMDAATSWRGSDSAWQVKESRLQSHSRQAGSTFYLSTPSALALSASWEWWMRLDFNTSSANYADVYLVADSANLPAAGNSGYFVRIGNTKDEVCLYRKDPESPPVMLVDGRDGVTDRSSGELRIRVTRNERHQWQLWTDATGTGRSYVAEGAFTDSTFNTSSHMGFVVRQSTASFFEKHFFDELLTGPLMKDTVLPVLESVRVISAQELVFYFSGMLDSATAADPIHYRFSPSLTVADIKVPPPLFNTVQLQLAQPLPAGTVYTVSPEGVTDHYDRQVGTGNNNVFVLPAVPDSFDIVINEVLYDPATGIPEFVELYNRSSRVVSLEQLYITKRRSNGQLDALTQLSREEVLLLPGAYAAFTTDPATLCRQYTCMQPESIYRLNLPALTNKEGTVILLNAAGQVLDELLYTDKMHFVLGDHTKGVSLERLEAGAPTQDLHNWHSAAAAAGFATPGSKNSQQLPPQGATGELTLLPEIFSPDNDGVDDMAVIRYQLAAPGFVANMTVFDVSGRPVRYLMRNNLLTINGKVVWDGLGESGRVLPTGIYIIVTEMFNAEGLIKHWKLPVVLARR